MTRCFSFTYLRDRCYRYTFNNSGLWSTTTDLGDGTVLHCWAPKAHQESKPNLLLIHGFGANAMWQWGDLVGHMTPHFNVYVPDLLFFGESYTSRPERADSFQAQCLMRLMEAHSVKGRLSLVGLSYGGFVAYSMAAQFKEVVERVVICCAAICMEEKDLVEGKFKVKDLEDAADILLPQTPEKLKELMSFTMVKPPKIVPNCFLNDFIHPTLIIWGDQDQVFPVEFAYRLKSHLGDNAQLVVLKKAGHGFNVERPKEFYKHLKAFLIGSQTSHHNHSNSSGK
uniref:AB hydrolase-1 domain-containing protein n=1 Tax=Chenopodium quinoa TaxID=63459 RepID=A0A803LUN0_CHEQI